VSCDLDADGNILLGTRGGFILKRSLTSDDSSWPEIVSYGDQDFQDMPVKQIRHSAAGHTLLSVSAHNKAVVFTADDSDYKVVAEFPLPADGVVGAAVSSDGKEMDLLAGNNKLLRAWLGSLSQSIGYSDSDRIALSPNNDFAVRLDYGANRLSFYDADLHHRFMYTSTISKQCEPSAFAIAPDGRTIAVGCADGMLGVLSPTAVLFVDPVSAFATGDEVTSIVSAGNLIAAGSKSGQVTVWTAPDASPQKPWTASRPSRTEPCMDKEK